MVVIITWSPYSFLFQRLFWIYFFTLFKKDLWISNSSDNE